MKEIEGHVFGKGEYLILVAYNNDPNAPASWICTPFKQTNVQKLPKDIQTELPTIIASVISHDVNKEGE